jgi:hypothetical protein
MEIHTTSTFDKVRKRIDDDKDEQNDENEGDLKDL